MQNGIILDGYAEIKAKMAQEEALKTISANTKERMIEYFGRVINVPVGEKIELNGQEITKSGSRKFHSHKVAILERNYEITDGSFEWVRGEFGMYPDKVRDTITLVRIR